MIPTIWGNHFWKTLHYISLEYPNFPTENDKNAMKNIINALPYLLPCIECRFHIKKNLEIYPLTDDILSIKLKLVLWLHNLHNMVNIMLKKNTMTFEEAMLSLFKNKNTEISIEIANIPDHNDTFEELLNDFNNIRYSKNLNNNDIININNIYDKYQEELNRNNKILEQTKKSEEEFKKNKSVEFINDLEKRKLEIKKRLEEIKYKKLYESYNHVTPVIEYQTNINIKLLTNLFFNEMKKSDKLTKHHLYIGLKLIYSCF